MLRKSANTTQPVLHPLSKASNQVDGLGSGDEEKWSGRLIVGIPTPYLLVVNTRVTRTAPHGSHVVAQVELSTKVICASSNHVSTSIVLTW